MSFIPSEQLGYQGNQEDAGYHAEILYKIGEAVASGKYLEMHYREFGKRRLRDLSDIVCGEVLHGTPCDPSEDPGHVISHGVVCVRR